MLPLRKLFLTLIDNSSDLITEKRHGEVVFAMGLHLRNTGSN